VENELDTDARNHVELPEKIKEEHVELPEKIEEKLIEDAKLVRKSKK
jgi:hypothetical protein